MNHFIPLQPELMLYMENYRQVINTEIYPNIIVLFYEWDGFRKKYGQVQPKVVPDLAIDIVIDLEGVPELSFIRGSADMVRECCFGDRKYFGLRLLPMGSNALLGYMDVAFLNKTIPLLDLLPEWRGQIIKMQSAHTMESRIEMVQDLFSHNMRKKYNSNRIYYMEQRIFETGGMLPINDLAKELGYSPRHIYHLFVGQFGFGIKTFSRIVRFQNAVWHIMMRENKGTELAYDLGYYDQSHFIREFRSMAGVTPNYYISLRQKYEISEISYY